MQGCTDMWIVTNDGGHGAGYCVSLPIPCSHAGDTIDNRSINNELLGH